mmetsp:Transcript_163680/g.524904  ORF Transcript_163680/g.524904 Transcript_163680/m.524904 type:complete len:219 (+) Transcript_163680:21-677(+)
MKPCPAGRHWQSHGRYLSPTAVASVTVIPAIRTRTRVIRVLLVVLPLSNLPTATRTEARADCAATHAAHDKDDRREETGPHKVARRDALAEEGDPPTVPTRASLAAVSFMPSADFETSPPMPSPHCLPWLVTLAFTLSSFSLEATAFLKLADRTCVQASGSVPAACTKLGPSFCQRGSPKSRVLHCSVKEPIVVMCQSSMPLLTSILLINTQPFSSCA